MIQNILQASRQNWGKAWRNLLFRKKIIIGLIALFATIASFPFFFQYIEKRAGYQMNDWLLQEIPSINFSVPIFALIWFCTLIALLTAIRKPAFLLTIIYAYVLVTVCRFITITFIPLEPPKGLIPLADPLTNMAYGNTFITKDLFFSGHTSSVFLIYLCLNEKPAKYFALTASILVGIFLLFQHVHYTVDVIMAPLFTYAIYKLSKKITTNSKFNDSIAG